VLAIARNTRHNHCRVDSRDRSFTTNHKMAMVDVGHVAAYTGGLNAQVGWLGRRVGGRPALTYIRRMNRVNSRSGYRSR